MFGGRSSEVMSGVGAGPLRDLNLGGGSYRSGAIEGGR